MVNHDLAVEIGLFRTCSHMISEKPQTGTGEQYICPFAESLTPTTAHRPESATSPHGSPRTCSTTCHRDTNGHRHGRDAAAPETFAPGLPSMPARCGHNGAAERLRARTRPQQGPLAEPAHWPRASSPITASQKAAPQWERRLARNTENRTAWQVGQQSPENIPPLFPGDGNRKRLPGRDAGPPTWKNNGRPTAQVRLAGAYRESTTAGGVRPAPALTGNRYDPLSGAPQQAGFAHGYDGSNMGATGGRARSLPISCG